MNKEIRNYSGDMQVSDDGRLISGYAAVFDSRSCNMGFYEFIDQGAFDGVIERSDVFATFNHSEDKVLARSNKGVGSLKLSIDNVGLRYEFEAPNTDLGNSIVEYIKRGDLLASSFAFTVAKDSWEHIGDEYIRHIQQIERLYDVSPVWTPAYEATSVSCRSFDDFKEEERIENEKRIQEEEEKRKAELAEYYTTIKNNYLNNTQDNA